MIKNILKFLLVVFVFTVSAVILYNNVTMMDDANLTEAGKILKHFTEDHRFNKIKFNFIKIETPHLNYSDERSGIGMPVTAATGLFLVSSALIIFAGCFRRSFIVDQFLFASGFEPSIFQPPKFTR